MDSVNTGAGSSRGVAIKGNYAIFTKSSQGVGFVDISNPSNLGAISFVTTTSDVSRDIIISGNYAYAAAGASGVAIIDVTDP